MSCVLAQHSVGGGKVSNDRYMTKKSNVSPAVDLPIEVSDVHAWTSVIDDLLSDGEALMTIPARLT